MYQDHHRNTRYQGEPVYHYLKCALKLRTVVVPVIRIMTSQYIVQSGPIKVQLLHFFAELDCGLDVICSLLGRLNAIT